MLPHPAPLAEAALADLLATHPASAALIAGLRPGDIVRMREKGVAHAHFRLAGRGLVLRVPRLSQWALPPEENLAYQAACFGRAAPSGATPRLAATLPVSDALPRGALLVEDIAGRPPRLPRDLPAIAASLARIHALPVPVAAQRPPLADHGALGPIAGTLDVIERQVPALEEAALPRETHDALLAELDWARRLAATAPVPDQPITLVGTDTHPGNFLIRDDGSAVLVDLEKALYGSPAIDLAHTSLFTSTTWDLDVQATLSRDEVMAFYRCYLERIGPREAAQLRPWLLPCRRLTWLRTMMWCVRWRVASAANPDWSERRVDPTLLAHIRRRVGNFFAPETVATLRAEWLEAPLLSLSEAQMDISLAIIENGAVVEAQGLDAPVPWWSFTKTVTAAAALALVRDGRLALDQVLPDRRCTLRQLLGHRAGLTDYGGLAAYHEAVAREDEPWPVPELLQRTHADTLRYEPGHGWGYSNIGYLFVRRLLEETCGESFDAVLRRLVLQPLGITGVHLATRQADLDGVSMGAASSYHPGWAYPGFLVGRLRDAGMLLQGLLTGDLLPPNLRDEMLDAHRLGGSVPGRPWSAAGYGLGLMSGTTADGIKACGHTGGGPGSVIAVYHLPEVAAPFTAAAFVFGDDQALVESAAFGRGRG